MHFPSHVFSHRSFQILKAQFIKVWRCSTFFNKFENSPSFLDSWIWYTIHFLSNENIPSYFAVGPPLLFPVYFQFMLFRHIYTRKLWTVSHFFIYMFYFLRILIQLLVVNWLHVLWAIATHTKLAISANRKKKTGLKTTFNIHIFYCWLKWGEYKSLRIRSLKN